MSFISLLNKSIIVLVLASLTSSSAGAEVNFKNIPENAVADYQLGGPYNPPAGVNVVVRDSTAAPAAGLYNICYINGFQTQPGVTWPADLLVTRPDGKPLVDAGWPDEFLLNISTDNLRAKILAQLAGSISNCANSGFNAVEFDNLDSFTRSEGALTIDDAFAFARLLVRSAHDHGLAAGQKNAPDFGVLGRDQLGFDFVISEQCDRYQECDIYTSVYVSHVINIEYDDNIRRSFEDICADPDTPKDTILRDMLLTPEGSASYIYDHC